MDISNLQAYADLLEIRHKAARRNSTIAGAVFILALAGFITLGMLGKIGDLEMYLAAAMLIAFAMAFTTSLIKLETVAGLHELCRHLL